MARKDPINKTSLPNGKEEIDTVVRRNGMAGSPGKPLERQRETSVNGNLQIAFKDIRTRPIIRMVFSELCPNCARQLERDNLSRKDAQVVNRVAKLLLDMIKKTNQVSVNLEDFTRQKWTLHVGNLYTEYSKVSYEVFKDDINWGRVSIFLGFSVSFAIYVDQQNIPGSANSVLEWACQVVEEDLGRFFLSNQGWVSAMLLFGVRPNTS